MSAVKSCIKNTTNSVTQTQLSSTQLKQILLHSSGNVIAKARATNAYFFSGMLCKHAINQLTDTSRRSPNSLAGRIRDCLWFCTVRKGLTERDAIRSDCLNASYGNKRRSCWVLVHGSRELLPERSKRLTEPGRGDFEFSPIRCLYRCEDCVDYVDFHWQVLLD